MEEDIKGQILAASFWENWSFYKELCRSSSPKRFKQRDEVEKIRKDWIKHQQDVHENSIQPLQI